MPDRMKQMTRRPKKRKGFCGNPSRSSTTSSDLDNSNVIEQHDEERIEQLNVVEPTVSSKKVENINNAKADVLSNTSGYRIMDLEILSGVIN